MLAQSYEMNELKTTSLAMLKLVENCFCFHRNDVMIKLNDKQTQDAAKANSAAQHTVFVFSISSMTVFCVRIWSLESEASRMWKNLHFDYMCLIFVWM